MQNSSLKITNLDEDSEVHRIINLRITHSRASIPLLEASTFRDPREAAAELCSFGEVEACVILQTCNRVEIYVVGRLEMGGEIAEYWRDKTGLDRESFYNSLEVASGSTALLHLLRLSSGLESMMVGEDQILGQVQDAYKTAKKCGTAGPLLDLILRHAIKTGRKIRFETGINRGLISIGSAAVYLLDSVLGDLNGREVAILGAGENATLVGKALLSKKQVKLFVANRTYERGVRLAKMLGGCAVPFDMVEELLTHVDAAVVATAAPHHILTKGMIEDIMDKRSERGLIIIDLSQPRNVAESVADLSGITLCNIDELRGIAEKNLQARIEAAKKAEAMVLEEQRLLESLLKRERAEDVISNIWFNVEEIRRRELNKALRLLADLDDEERKIVEKLTQVMAKKILHTPIQNLRRSATSDDMDIIRTAQVLFNISYYRGGKRN